MTIQTLVRWATELPTIVWLLSFSAGVIPLFRVRFGSRQTARIRVRGRGSLTLVNRLSAMVFMNIWIRREYPVPTDQDVVLDLGANIGLFTTFALSHGARFCHCVEPCPASVEHLNAHVREFGFEERTHIIAKAVGEASGSGFIPSTSNVNNVVSPEMKTGLVQVEVADVAKLVDSLNPAPTYIKFDIESNEVPVLRRLLASSAIRSVRTIAVEAMNGAETIASLLDESGFVASIRPRSCAIIVGVR